MSRESKGESPFYPGQPVPVDLFVGRKEEISRLERAISQTAGGKPQAVFISGDYGIGKSSLARYVREMADQEYGLLGFHVLLGKASSTDDIAIHTVQSVFESYIKQKTSISETFKNMFAKYVGEQSLFGVTLRFDELKKDAPDISNGFLPFLKKIHKEAGNDYKGLMLIFDEINGIASKPFFARFIKDLVDSNALSTDPLPLLIVLCGTEDKYRDIVTQHKPVERIFEIAQLNPMTKDEMSEFYETAFDKVEMDIDEDAMDFLLKYSSGLPKLMHLIGDAAFWIADEDTITEPIALQAIFTAADDVGRKFVDQQVYKALQSKDYRSILKKLAKLHFSREFNKNEIAKGLNETEKKKLNNFLQKMKKLNVLVSGDDRGIYQFRDALTSLYIYMKERKDRSF
jgi:Cdc6-like AAA superfamily ATPase